MYILQDTLANNTSEERGRLLSSLLKVSSDKNFISQKPLRIEIRLASPGSRASWAKSIYCSPRYHRPHQWQRTWMDRRPNSSVRYVAKL